MTVDKQKRPNCYADMQTVFPEGEDGLRHSPESCLRCALKTDCLRAAMQGGPGLDVREANVDRAYASGMIGFLERWSQKKELDTRRKQKSEN
jgi:hypothetical protein